MSLIINKFGGGIINSASAIKYLAEIFQSYHRQSYSVNVFSAFGKTTNNLEKVLNAYLQGDRTESGKILAELKFFHLEIAREFFPKEHIIFGEVANIFEKIQITLQEISSNEDNKFVYDQVIPYGEILASLIVSNYFSYVGISNKLVNATDFLETDSNFNSANVDKVSTLENIKTHITQEIFASHKNIITQGFIGFCDEGMTALGREGSDYTAGLLGNLMNAEKVVLWKDVPGVMDKNPKLAGNENAQKIDFLSYEDFAKHLQTNSAGLVHPKTLNEVREKKIPLQVRPFFDLDSEGTLIS